MYQTHTSLLLAQPKAETNLQPNVTLMSTFRRCWIYGRHQETLIAITVSVCHSRLYWCHVEKSARMKVRGECSSRSLVANEDDRILE